MFNPLIWIMYLSVKSSLSQSSPLLSLVNQLLPWQIDLGIISSHGSTSWHGGRGECHWGLAFGQAVSGCAWCMCFIYSLIDSSYIAFCIAMCMIHVLYIKPCAWYMCFICALNKAMCVIHVLYIKPCAWYMCFMYSHVRDTCALCVAMWARL